VTILGPTLFLIYVNDIPDRPDAKLSLFGDDTALLNRGNQTPPIRHAETSAVHITVVVVESLH
jgi:hypothetical protein